MKAAQTGYTVMLAYATRCIGCRRRPARSGQVLRDRNMSRDPPDQRRIWYRRSVRLVGAVPRNASGSVAQYMDRHPLR
jgi:hypothetical protein